MPVDHSHYRTAALGKRVKELFCMVAEPRHTRDSFESHVTAGSRGQDPSPF